MIAFNIYSPVDKIEHPLLTEHDVDLFIKRDDQIHPFISGNKWRKLKYNLLKAEQENKKHLVTFGGAWSNHLLATACAAAKFGFKSTGFVRGEELSNEVLFLCQLFGMTLKFIDRESYRDKRSLFNVHCDDAIDYFIDEGGSGPEAAIGCAELVSELPEEYDHIFCAAGTGSTSAGIINGLLHHNYTTKMNIVPVLKGADYLQDEIKKLLITESEFDFHTQYHFGGYAKTNPDLLDFIKDFSKQTGILLDPIYTGKTVYAIFDLISKKHFPRGSKILAIHTGGLFGLLGMKEKFSFNVVS